MGGREVKGFSGLNAARALPVILDWSPALLGKVDPVQRLRGSVNKYRTNLRPIEVFRMILTGFGQQV